jgi:hypothetical protein
VDLEDEFLMENRMRQSRTKPASGSSWPDRCRDKVEQKIIRAYVQLAVSPDRADGPRTATLARFGSLEVRLTETSQTGAPPTLPSYWLEIYSHATGSIIASCGCCEFDEDELAAAVEFVYRAKQNYQELN